MKNKNTVAAVLAIMAMATFIAAFFMLAWLPVPEGNKPFLNQSLIALIGLVGTAFGFYLGSSYGSAQKNGLIEKVASPPRVLDFSTQSVEVPAVKGEAGFIRLPLLGLFVILGFCLLFGCATAQKETPQTIAAKSLLTMKETIIATAEVGDRLCTGGRLDVGTCQDLKSYYILAGPAYDLAVDAYTAAVKIDSAANWDKYNTAVQELSILYLGITQIATKTGLIKLADGGALPSGGSAPAGGAK